MKLDINLTGAQQLIDYMSYVGRVAPTYVHLAVVSATGATGEEGRRLFGQITKIKRTRLRRRIVVKSLPDQGRVFIGLLPLPAAWVAPLDPPDMDPARQRRLSGVKSGGGRFYHIGAFVARVPDSKSPAGYRLAIWRRKGPERFPVSEHRITISEFGGDNIGQQLQDFAMARLIADASAQLDRLLAQEKAKEARK